MFYRFQMLSIILFLFLSISSFGPSLKIESVHKKNARPNVIMILADDIGYECFGTYGTNAYQTPNVDKMASQGVKFTNCYSTPLCTPSRVMLMTGKYNFRNYEDFGYLSTKEKTIGSIFKDAGYSTCISGKWQLNGIAQKKEGWESADRPYQFGFEEYCLWQ